MTERVWSRDDRERAYTSLCLAVTAAGPAGEVLLLARLSLLLAEELGDADAFARCLAEARATPDPHDPGPEA